MYVSCLYQGTHDVAQLLNCANKLQGMGHTVHISHHNTAHHGIPTHNITEASQTESNTQLCGITHMLSAPSV